MAGLEKLMKYYNANRRSLCYNVTKNSTRKDGYAYEKNSV